MLSTSWSIRTRGAPPHRIIVCGSNSDSRRCTVQRRCFAAFLLAWDEFFYALLFTSDQNSKTVTVAIADLAGGRVSDYGLIATAGVLAALPPVIIGIFMQRSLISGLTAGGVKG